MLAVKIAVLARPLGMDGCYQRVREVPHPAHAEGGSYAHCRPARTASFAARGCGTALPTSSSLPLHPPQHPDTSHGLMVPRRPGSSQHDKANTKFFDRITEAMMNHVDFAVVKCVLIASPAFLKDQYYE